MADYTFLQKVHGAFLIPEIVASMLSSFLIVLPTNKYDLRNVDIKWETAFLHAVAFYCFVSSTIHFVLLSRSKTTSERLPQLIFYLHHNIIASIFCFIMGIWVVISEAGEDVSVLNLAHYTAGLLTLINSVLFAGGYLSLRHQEVGKMFTRPIKSPTRPIKPPTRFAEPVGPPKKPLFRKPRFFSPPKRPTPGMDTGYRRY